MIEFNTSTHNNLVHFTVSCFFERNRSWTINRQSDYLLAHEQVHFDIAEVYARKLRRRLKQLRDLNHQNLERKVREVYREINRQHGAFQSLYDRETNHSKKPSKQAEWEAKVAEMLRQTSEYAETDFSIPFRY